MSGLKERLLKELSGELAKEDAKIKELESQISAEMFARSTITGGAFANAARNACDKRADAARASLKNVKQNSAWKREMLSKYK